MAIAAADLIAPSRFPGALADSLLRAIGESRAPAVVGEGAASTVAGTFVTAAALQVAAVTPPFTDEARADRATFALASAGAYEERADQILSDPTSMSGERAGSVSFSTSQAQELRKKAAAAREAFDAVVAEEAAAVADVAAKVPPAVSRSTAALFTW